MTLAIVGFLYLKKKAPDLFYPILVFTVLNIYIVFIYINMFQSRQYRISLLHYESTSKELYWAVFLSNERPGNYEELLDPIDSEKAFKGE